MEPNNLIIIGLAALAAGGLFYALVYPYLSGDIKAERRQAAMQKASTRRSDRTNDPMQRRKQIAESLREAEAKSKSKKLTMEARIAQAGLSWSRNKFYLISACVGLVLGGIVYLVSDNIWLALGALAAGALGVPRWILNIRRKRRQKKFLNAFPDAVDVIVRGVKAGLPLGDCLRVIAQESAEPVRTEFRLAIESTALGLSLGEAAERIVDRVPVAEASFFAIVLTIQQKAGGNLSEALTNLSRVLRDRKKLKAKVQAVSSEAKASAAIIGSLPFIVGTLVWLISPRYIELLWLTSGGRMVLGCCFTWMFMGVMVMRKMINFEV
jgi:tight adherence protein B